MLAINQPYTVLLTLAALIPAILIILILKQRPNLGARSFATLMAAVSLWAFVSLFEVCSQDTNTKIFSYQIKYLFIVMVPSSWLIFSLYYANRLQKLAHTHLALLLIGPVVTLLLVATNPYHQMMFSRFDIVNTDNYRLLYPHFGPLFWFHALYSYILLGIGFVFLLKNLVAAPAHYRHQAAYLIVGGMAPWICNIAFVFNLGPLPYFDFTPVVFSISGVAFMWGILRYKLLDIIPIARDVVIQSMRDGVIVVDNNDNIIDLNHTARRLAGIKEGHVIGTSAEQIIPWWSKLKRYSPSAQEADQPALEMKDGDTIRFLQLSQSPLLNKGKRLGIMLTLRDVTATKLAEKAMRESEARFKSLSENAPVIIFSLDENGKLDYANPAWQVLLGHSRREIMGRPLADFTSRDQNHSIGRTFERLMDGRLPTVEFDLHMAHKDGTQHLFNTSASANLDSEGRVTGIIGLAKDVTEEKRLELQLIQSQKMEAIGTLAGGIAHDFNNLLMGMQANLSLMRMETGQPREFDEKFQRIEDQIQNGASLTRQLLGYARKGKYAVTVFDLNELVEDTLNVVRRTNKNIVVNVHLNEKPAFIGADQGQMELVLLNLFVNALDAMPQGGELTVSTAVKHTLRQNEKHPSAEDGHFVELTVADTGTGMDKATLNRIFEPFFTTKEIGRGTGLGLASVYGVIQNHCGHISVASKPAEGTTFTIQLPNTEDPEATCAMAEETGPMAVEGCKILLVDDEPLILKYSHEMISSLGMSVLSTQYADEAIRIYENHWEEIDIVMLDMVMPKMDGLQLFRAMEKINPHVRVILATGYAMDNRVSELMAAGHHQFLKKPYTRADLATAITGLLSNQPQLIDPASVKTG